MTQESIKIIGGITVAAIAFLSFMRILIKKDFIPFFRRPKLRIVFDPSKDVRIFDYDDMLAVRKCANLCIENKGKQTAKNSTAIMRIISKPPNVSHLEREYNLHWADISYSNETIRPQPIDIAKGQTRLDVAFTQEDQQIGGCWISTPYALNNVESERNQFYLPPGVYKIEVIINCENGKGDKRRYRIFSPKDWDKLKMEGINSLFIRTPNPKLSDSLIQPHSTAGSSR